MRKRPSKVLKYKGNKAKAPRPLSLHFCKGVFVSLHRRKKPVSGFYRDTVGDSLPTANGDWRPVSVRFRGMTNFVMPSWCQVQGPCHNVAPHRSGVTCHRSAVRCQGFTFGNVNYDRSSWRLLTFGNVRCLRCAT